MSRVFAGTALIEFESAKRETAVYNKPNCDCIMAAGVR